MKVGREGDGGKLPNEKHVFGTFDPFNFSF